MHDEFTIGCLEFFLRLISMISRCMGKIKIASKRIILNAALYVRHMIKKNCSMSFFCKENI